MKAINTLLLLIIGMTAGTAIAEDGDPYLQKAREILADSPIIDGHNDLPWVLRNAADGDTEQASIVDPSGPDTDLDRLEAGLVGAQIWSVYVPSAIEPVESVRFQIEQIDLVHRMVKANPDRLEIALSVADVERARENGRVASLIGIEGAHTIANSLAMLRSYYALGVRSVGLTHLHSTDWADSATGERKSGGLSAFGEDAIREMNRLGMMIDLAHTSAETVDDVVAVSSAPVIVSHTAATAVVPHERNLTDASLTAIAENGGVIMVCFIPVFVSDVVREWQEGMMPLIKEAKTEEDWIRINEAYVAEHGTPDRATISDVADHIDHIARVAGIDHVGIGADFYGAHNEYDLVQGLEDVSKYPALFAELLRRGWEADDLKKLSRGNVLRVFAEVEKAARN
ncbi:MAG: dipeptidase [Woeseiaceae bacterium]|nr:dipeptidase [Woeseiaceae bacterium]